LVHGATPTCSERKLPKELLVDGGFALEAIERASDAEVYA
jgi:hypothetical protein